MCLKPILIPGLKTQMTKDLLNYLLEQCRAWMLPEEIKALTRSSLTKSGEEKLKASSVINPDLENSYGFKDPKTNFLVALGEEKMQLAIAERMLKDSGNELLNHCPKCQKLARTPKAKRCRFCNFDWHK